MGETFLKGVFLLVLVICGVFLVLELTQKEKSEGSESVITGFATHSGYSDFSAAEGGFRLSRNLISINDTVIYRTGWYSLNGSSWQNFTLAGNSYFSSTVWLSGTASYSLPYFGEGENYVIVYSCTYNTANSSWDCHGNNWQLNIVGSTLPNCSDGVRNRNETGVDCGGECAACPVPVQNTKSVAQSFTDNSGFSNVGSPLIINGALRISADSGGTILDDPRLVSLYRFESSANLGFDSKDTNNMNIVRGDPVQSATVPPGKSGYSIDLDGDDQVCISSGFTFDPSEDHTMCFWVRKTSFVGDGNVFAQHCTYDTWDGDSSYLFTANNCYGSESISIPNVYTLNQWVHLCQTYESTNNNMRFYINGNNVLNQSLPNPIRLTADIWCIGGCNGGCWMTGQVFEPMWFNSILAAGEISDIYSGAYSCNTAASATATSLPITESMVITNVSNLSYSVVSDNLVNSAFVQFSFDNGVTWFNLSPGETLNNPGLSSELIYRITLSSLNGSISMDNLQFSYSLENISTECSAGQTRQCGSTDVGACSYGSESCVMGEWSGTCVGYVGSVEEVCNAVDDDCDGQTNEALTRQTTCGVGRCAGTIGTETCNSLGSWTGNTCNPYANAITEICTNTIDDDCDGFTDGADAVSCPLACVAGDGQCAIGCTYLGGDTDCPQVQAIVADHTSAMAFDQGHIPVCWIERAKTLTFQYAHRSDGNNIFEGLEALYTKNSTLRFTKGFNYLPAQTNPIGIRMMDGNPVPYGNTGYSTYMYSNLYWSDNAGRNATYDNSNTGFFNYSMWSWCDELSYQSLSSTQYYLDTLNSMEPSYTKTRLIYMNAFASSSSIANNELVRNYSITNGKIFFDFEDIGRYDPAGNFYPNADRECTWCGAWCAAHPSDCAVLPSTCQHSHGFLCLQRGKAFWWMMARLAGWNGLPAGAGANSCT